MICTPHSTVADCRVSRRTAGEPAQIGTCCGNISGILHYKVLDNSVFYITKNAVVCAGCKGTVKMKNLAASREVSSLDRKFIVLAGAIPNSLSLNFIFSVVNFDRCKQRGMDPRLPINFQKYIGMCLSQRHEGTEFLSESLP